MLPAGIRDWSLLAVAGHPSPMTYARHFLVMEHEAGFYHCVSRCVRRAFLCGCDPLSGRDFSHRRHWIERRIHLLSSAFSISIYAYAVMSNHVHLAVHSDPRRPWQWSDRETARRWLMVFPGRSSTRSAALDQAQRISLLVHNQERMEEIRRRLGSLSWFMRALNEAIARQANKEDGCTGRFWEGRFKCQALLDESAIIACMTYIDLNPLRAGASRHASRAPFTSSRWRQRALASGKSPARPLEPVAGSCGGSRLEVTEGSYLTLLEWSARKLHPEKPAPAPILRIQPGRSLQEHQGNWLCLVSSIEQHFFRAIGSASALLEFAARAGQRWVKGSRLSKYPDASALILG